jgi:hypothetical protein
MTAGDLCGMRFQCEVPSVEKADDCSWNVALECLRAGPQEERIVLTPHGEERRLVSAEVGLESRVERDVAFVVAEQVQLRFIRAWAGQIEIVQRPTIGGNHRLVGHTVGILPTRRSGSEEGAKSFSIGWRRVLPVGADGVPALAQPLLVGVAVLGDDRGGAARMLRGDPEANRRAVVEVVDREAFQANDFREAVNDAGDVVECVGELGPRRHLRLAEAWQVGRDDVEAIGEERDEIPKHVARAGEAMKQQQRRRIGAPSLATEDHETVHVGRTIFDGSHCVSPSEHADTRGGRRRLTGVAGTRTDQAVRHRRGSGSEYSRFGRHSFAARWNAG